MNEETDSLQTIDERMSVQAEGESTIAISNELADIKGDAIGDTLYSERWVLRILIKLSEITDDSWDEDFEQTLCALWDTTTEKDMVNFLLCNDFYRIFCRVIRSMNNARCIEIMVGILGNMCCVEEAKYALARHDAGVLVVNLITSEDSLVLVQVVRLMTSCLWGLKGTVVSRQNSPCHLHSSKVCGAESQANSTITNFGEMNPWLETVFPLREMILRHLCFFLSSAINDELLCSTLELLDTLLYIPSFDLARSAASSDEFANGLAECLRQILKGVKVGDCLSSNRRLWRAVHVWMGLIGHVASYPEGKNNLKTTGDILTKCFTKLVVLLTSPEALKTQDPDIASLCLCVLEALPDISISAPVLARLTRVLFLLDRDLDQLTEDSEDSKLAVRSLLHRAIQFLKITLDKTEDLVLYLENLEKEHIEFLRTVTEKDLWQKLERALLRIRTNGLVQ